MKTIRYTSFENYEMHKFIVSVNKYMHSINQNLDLNKACVHNVLCLKINTNLKPSQIIYNEDFNRIRSECEISTSDDGNVVFIYKTRKNATFLRNNIILITSCLIPIFFEFIFTNYINNKWKPSMN